MGALSDLRNDQDGFARLTPREREALRRTAAGDSAKVIGRAMGISHRTVHNYQQEAARKLGVTGSFKAARLLIEHEAEGGVDVHPASQTVAISAENVVLPAPSPQPISDEAGQQPQPLPSRTQIVPEAAGRKLRLTTFQVVRIILSWAVGSSLVLAMAVYILLHLAVGIAR